MNVSEQPQHKLQPSRAARAKNPRPCSIADALSVVGEKYSLLVLREVFFGVHRFDAIAKNIGAPATSSPPGCAPSSRRASWSAPSTAIAPPATSTARPRQDRSCALSC